MKGTAVFFFIVLFFAAVFFGYRFIIGKTLNSSPHADVSETTSLWQGKSQEASDLQQRQRDLTQQRMDRMRDFGHR